MPSWRAILAILSKDLRSERRTKESVVSMIVFSVLLLVIFNFSLGADSAAAVELAPGILWAAIVFTGTLGLNRSFATEMEHKGLSGMMLAPIDRSAIYFGKLLSNLVFMFTVELILIPLFILFFNLDLSTLDAGAFLNLALVFVFGTFGYAAVGTVLAAIAANSNLREILLPLLLFPIVVPVVISAAEATRLILLGEEMLPGEWGPENWIRVLIAFAMIFMAAAWMVFDSVLED